MKVTRDHLTDLENWVEDAVRDASSHWQNYFGFGLLPAAGGDKPSLRLTIEADELILHRCQAVLPGGTRIFVDSATALKPRFNLEKLRQQIENYHENVFVFDVWLAVDPEAEKTPVGEPSPHDSRQPYALPKYILNVPPAGQTNNKQLFNTHLLIGKLVVKGAEFALDDKFVPPCTAMESHPVLSDVHIRVSNMLSEVMQNAISVKNKIQLRPHKNRLEENILYLSERLAFLLADSLDHFKIYIPCESPRAYACFIARVARNMTVALDMTTRKDSVLQYFSQWMNVQPGELDASMRNMLDLEYNPNNIPEMLRKTEQYVSLLNRLYRLLKDREYVEAQKSSFIED